MLQTQYHKKAKKRIFDVFVGGVLVVDNLDIYTAAPGNNVPYIVTFSTFVSDGVITIDLVRNTDNPQINGIEVFDDGAPIPAPTVAPLALPPNSAPLPPFQDIVINCGGMLCIIQRGMVCLESKTNSAALFFIRIKVHCTWKSLANENGVLIVIFSMVARIVFQTYLSRIQLTIPSTNPNASAYFPTRYQSQLVHMKSIFTLPNCKYSGQLCQLCSISITHSTLFYIILTYRIKSFHKSKSS